MPRIEYRDGKPAVRVKDDALWARDPRTAPLYDVLSESVIDAIYEDTREDFWNLAAPELAREHGYSGKVWSAGHSSGWLVLDDRLDWTEHVDRSSLVPLDFAEGVFGVGEEYDDAEFRAAVAGREQFLHFAAAVDDAVSEAGEEFAYRLRERVAEDAREASERAYWAARDVVTVDA
jgi:hypothetical protein